MRDREEGLEHRLRGFARYVTPLTGRTRIAITAINAPVRCGGARVRLGDLIVADGSGVICVAAEHATKVAALPRRYARDDATAVGELARAQFQPSDGEVHPHLAARAGALYLALTVHFALP